MKVKVESHKKHFNSSWKGKRSFIFVLTLIVGSNSTKQINFYNYSEVKFIATTKEEFHERFSRNCGCCSMTIVGVLEAKKKEDHKHE